MSLNLAFAPALLWMSAEFVQRHTYMHTRSRSAHTHTQTHITKRVKCRLASRPVYKTCATTYKREGPANPTTTRRRRRRRHVIAMMVIINPHRTAIVDVEVVCVSECICEYVCVGWSTQHTHTYANKHTHGTRSYRMQSKRCAELQARCNGWQVIRKRQRRHHANGCNRMFVRARSRTLASLAARHRVFVDRDAGRRWNESDWKRVVVSQTQQHTLRSAFTGKPNHIAINPLRRRAKFDINAIAAEWLHSIWVLYFLCLPIMYTIYTYTIYYVSTRLRYEV